MHEFTKSAVSAGLAGSLFGIRQMTNIFTAARPGEAHTATEAFNSVAHAMVDQCGGSLRETFSTADKMQRDMVDLSFRFLTLDQRQSAGTANSWMGMVGQTTGQMGQWLSKMVTRGGCGSGCGSGCDCDDTQSEMGWGPVNEPDSP